MNAAPDAELIAAVRRWLAERRALWINQTYLHEGDAAQREYFLKPLDGGAVQLGFDDWLDRYEDATDLYVRHERQRFDSLELALAYTFEQLPLRAGDFGRAMGALAGEALTPALSRKREREPSGSGSQVGQ